MKISKRTYNCSCDNCMFAQVCKHRSDLIDLHTKVNELCSSCSPVFSVEVTCAFCKKLPAESKQEADT